MEKGPENKEAPNAAELLRQRKRSEEEKKRLLGEAAIKAVNRGK
ncbi:hypothetical protein GCM10009789_21510 [Kribbella sancticallisti]|uniref:Uncharacterized protein n=1 Tax=Kribbella sancticallisti TaxID=460087 RepID=A0ABP4NVB4_9ACTN